METALLLPAVERVRRLRAEASARALVDPTSLHVSTPPAGEATTHGAAVERLGIPAQEEGTGAAEGSIVALMREWWPKLILVAADAGEWDFICR